MHRTTRLQGTICNLVDDGIASSIKPLGGNRIQKESLVGAQRAESARDQALHRMRATVPAIHTSEGKSTEPRSITDPTAPVDGRESVEAPPGPQGGGSQSHLENPTGILADLFKQFKFLPKLPRKSEAFIAACQHNLRVTKNQLLASKMALPRRVVGERHMDGLGKMLLARAATDTVAKNLITLSAGEVQNLQSIDYKQYTANLLGKYIFYYVAYNTDDRHKDVTVPAAVGNDKKDYVSFLMEQDAFQVANGQRPGFLVRKLLFADEIKTARPDTTALPSALPSMMAMPPAENPLFGLPQFAFPIQHPSFMFPPHNPWWTRSEDTPR